MHKLLLLLFWPLIGHSFVVDSNCKFSNQDSITVNIKLSGNKKTALALINEYQQTYFISFANMTEDSSIITKRIAIPFNHLLYYKTYYNNTFYDKCLFIGVDEVLNFEMDSNYSLTQIKPKLRNTYLNNIFNIYDDFSIKKPFDKFDSKELIDYYRITDSIFVSNKKRLENPNYSSHLSDIDYKKFLNFIKFDYYNRILAPISYNFPYSNKLDQYINPHLKSIEQAMRADSTLIIEKKKLVKYLMKYYMFHLNKNSNDLASYRDVLLEKNFRSITLSIIIEKLESYPTKGDLVFKETFQKLNAYTLNYYKKYVDSIEMKFSNSKLDIENIYLLSNINNQKISFRQLLNQYRDNIIVLDFWASWCIPCIQEFPALIKLKSKYSDSSVKFIGISLDEDSKVANWTNILNKHKLDPDLQYKLIGPRQSALTLFYKIQSLPRYIVLDMHGELINDNFVLPTSIDFEKELIRILKKN